MERVHSKEMAMMWFIRTSLRNVECEREDGEVTICSSYPEAEEFYDNSQEGR